MKHATSRDLNAFLILVGLVSCGGCQQDRQMIFNNPRTLPVTAEKPNPFRNRNPLAKAEIPKPRPLPPANGVDVPIVDPN